MRRGQWAGIVLAAVAAIAEFSWASRSVGTVESSNPVQVAAKFAVFCGAGFLALLLLMDGSRRLLRAQWWFLAFLAWGGLVALAVTPNRVTLLASLSIVLVALACFVLGSRLDRPPLAYGWAALVTLAAVSLAAYAVDPGRFTLVASGVVRVRGILGHSNGLGQVAAMGLILHLPRFRRRAGLRDAAWWAVLALLLVALVLSRSRTALVMLLMALALSLSLRLYKWTGSVGLPLALVFLLASALGVVLFAPSFAEGLASGLVSVAARSGDLSELGTLTGRLDIWSVAWDLIRANPLVGHGWRSSETVLVSEWYARYGQTAFYPVHPHSMYLNLLLSTGLVGALLLATALASLGRRIGRIPSWYASDRRIAVWVPLLAFWAGVGLTENSALGTTNTSFVLFMLLVADVAWHAHAWSAEKRVQAAQAGTALPPTTAPARRPTDGALP